MRSDRKLNIAVLNHSTNIGNQFFEISIISELKKLFNDDANVFPVEGRHIFTEHYLTGSKSDYIDYGKYADCDYFVLSGPIFQNKTLRKNFNTLFERMSDRGTRLIFISAGSSEYSSEEQSDVRSVLSDHRPFIISSRDEYTYDTFGDLAEHSYNGICSAFYSSIHFEGYPTTELGKYIVLNFEEAPEPDLRALGSMKISEINFTPDEIERCSKASKLDFLLNFNERYQNKYMDYKIIRTLHSVVPSPLKLLVKRPNKFVSVNPYSYLNIFRNSELVLARRVHACVPALSYGKPAMLFNSTKRAQIFDRLQLSNIRKMPVVLDKGRLHDEHESFSEFLKSVKVHMTQAE